MYVVCTSYQCCYQFATMLQIHSLFVVGRHLVLKVFVIYKYLYLAAAIPGSIPGRNSLPLTQSSNFFSVRFWCLDSNSPFFSKLNLTHSCLFCYFN